MWPNDRRVAVLWVDTDTMISALLHHMTGETSEFIQVCPDLKDLLPQLRFYGVHYDCMSGGFQVRVGHPSFDEVHDGCPAPNLNLRMLVKRTTPPTDEPTIVGNP